MSAADAARAGYAGVKKKKGVVFAGFVNQALAFGTRLTPRSFNASMARKLQDID